MKKALSLLVVLCASNAWAADIYRNSYEINLLPEESKTLSMPFAGVVSRKVDGDGSKTGTRFGYEYLKTADDVAYGTRISYVDVGTDNENTKGLNDLEFVVKSQKDYKNESILYGATGYWSPTKRRFNNESSNNFSGGLGIEPYVGLVKKTEDVKWTFSLSYLKGFARKFVYEGVRPSALGEIDGGETLMASLDINRPVKQGAIGFGLAAANVAETRYDLGNTAAYADGVTALRGEVYWMGHVSPGVKFIPSLQYTDIKSGDTGGHDLQLNLAYLSTY